MNKAIGLAWLLAPVTLCALTAGAGAATQSPEEVIRTTADRVMERISEDRDELRDSPRRLRRLVDEVIAPHFDFPRMAHWVIGKHWRGADEEARSKFIDEFKNLLVRTYASALLEYSEQEIVYHPVDAEEGANMVTVKTEVAQSGSVPIPIHYRMHNKDGDWKVFDVAVDGVSLISTYRASFASEIRKGGLNQLIDTLAARNELPPSNTQ